MVCSISLCSPADRYQMFPATRPCKSVKLFVIVTRHDEHAAVKDWQQRGQRGSTLVFNTLPATRPDWSHSKGLGVDIHHPSIEKNLLLLLDSNIQLQLHPLLHKSRTSAVTSPHIFQLLQSSA